ncbi:MAG: alpha/beta hydrolase [Terriglobia bacterium]
MKSIIATGLLLMLALGAIGRAETKTDIEYAQGDGISLKLDAFLQEGPGPFPSILFVHGGGFTGGDKSSNPKPLFDLLSQAGYNWISINYRLSPKYVFPILTDDIERAIEFLKANAKEFKIDPNRMVLMGPSAGGHLVSLVGAKHKPGNRVAAVVSLYGEHDLITRTQPQKDCAIGGKVRHTDTPQTCLSGGLKAYMGIEEVNASSAQVIKDASPITYVQKDMPPYLLIHGTKDYDVPYEQSVLMQNAMRKAGARCDLITIQGGGHGGWDQDPAMRTYQKDLLEWLRQNL